MKKSCSAPQTSERLLKLAEKFSAVAAWDAAGLETALKALAAEMGIKTGELIHPCRVAVSGKSAGPSLYHMLEVLGRDRVLARLRRGAEKFRANPKLMKGFTAEGHPTAFSDPALSSSHHRGALTKPSRSY